MRKKSRRGRKRFAFRTFGTVVRVVSNEIVWSEHYTKGVLEERIRRNPNEKTWKNVRREVGDSSRVTRSRVYARALASN